MLMSQGPILIFDKLAIQALTPRDQSKHKNSIAELERIERPHWPWWRHISLQANYTAQTATIPQRLGGTRSCSGHSFSASKRPHFVLRVHLLRNRNVVCFCAIESSTLWQSLGLPILLLAAISLTKSSCRITNKRRLGRGNSRDFLEPSVFDRSVARRRRGPCFVSKRFLRINLCQRRGNLLDLPCRKPSVLRITFGLRYHCRRSESSR